MQKIEPEPIKEVVESVIRKLRPQGLEDLGAILKGWRKVLGWRPSKHCRPLTIRGERLIVNVDSSGWLFELTMHKQEILKKLNRLKASQIKFKDIVFKIGRIA